MALVQGKIKAPAWRRLKCSSCLLWFLFSYHEQDLGVYQAHCVLEEAGS